MMFTRLFPHQRASQLIDQRLDAERGDAALSSEDARFLDAHLARCASCSEMFETRKKAMEALRALGTAKAPQGFAGRVLLAAKARGRAAPEPVREAAPSWLSPMQQLAAAALFVVLLAGGVGAVVALGPSASPHDKHPTAPLTGGTGLHENTVRPHFVVRAPGASAAKTHAQITAIVHAHGGTLADQNGALIAHISRSALIAVTQDLAGRGAFKMTKAEELAPEASEVIIRFELD